MKEARRARSLARSRYLSPNGFCLLKLSQEAWKWKEAPLSQTSLPLPSLVEKRKNVKTAPRRSKPARPTYQRECGDQKILTASAKRLSDAATLVGEINVPIGLQRLVSPWGERKRVPIKLDHIFTSAFQCPGLKWIWASTK